MQQEVQEPGHIWQRVGHADEFDVGHVFGAISITATTSPW
jgi:hypothetical protein